MTKAEDWGALLRRPGRRRLQPLVGNERGDVLDLLGAWPCGRCRQAMDVHHGIRRGSVAALRDPSRWC